MIFFPRSSRMYLVDLEIISAVISSLFLHCIRIAVFLKYPSSDLLSRELHSENFHTCFCIYIFLLPSDLESDKEVSYDMVGASTCPRHPHRASGLQANRRLVSPGVVAQGWQSYSRAYQMPL